MTKCNQRHNGPLKTYKMSNKTAETVLFLNNEGKSKTFPENCDSKVPSVGTLLVYLLKDYGLNHNFFRNKTFLLNSWNFQHLFHLRFWETFTNSYTVAKKVSCFSIVLNTMDFPIEKSLTSFDLCVLIDWISKWHYWDWITVITWLNILVMTI